MTQAQTESAIITCTCTYCNGLQARVAGDGTRNGKPYSKAMLHNTVQLAHGPLSQAASAKRFGPWRV